MPRLPGAPLGGFACDAMGAELGALREEYAVNEAIACGVDEGGVIRRMTGVFRRPLRHPSPNSGIGRVRVPRILRGGTPPLRPSAGTDWSQALFDASEPRAIMTDSFELQRFADAQAPVYARVCDELRAGRKESHWMWFVFPQIAGLGQSSTSIFYAISSIDEAKAYLTHPILGPRLRECLRLTLAIDGRTAREIFGRVDEMKFRSSLTLFENAAPDEPLFAECLKKFFGGGPDPATLEKLSS